MLETADLAPDAATWRAGRSIRDGFDSGLLPTLYENVTSSTKPEVHNISPFVGNRATATGNMYRKFDEIGRVVFEICKRINKQKQTDRQTR